MDVVKCRKCGLTQMGEGNCKSCGAPLGSPQPAAPSAAGVAPGVASAPRVAAPASGAALGGRFAHSTYLLRRKVFTLVGASFHIYDPAGGLVLFSKMKAFKLKEDIRLYAEEEMTTEILVIKARRALDISSEYDVVDSTNGESVGVLKRKGLKSMIKDEWVIMNPNDEEIGLIQEDSLALALVRRLLTNLIPQKYRVTLGGTPVCTYKQNFNPFVHKLTVDFTPDALAAFDRRLGIAAAILLLAIEGRQQ
jgi:uncharacterized protein YxjI